MKPTHPRARPPTHLPSPLQHLLQGRAHNLQRAHLSPHTPRPVCPPLLPTQARLTPTGPRRQEGLEETSGPARYSRATRERRAATATSALLLLRGRPALPLCYSLAHLPLMLLQLPWG